MPRGKNYINQNKGMTLQAKSGTTASATTAPATTAKQKKSTVVESCFYGIGCTRKGCIYRHPKSTGGDAMTNTMKSDAPCKPYLAGMCSFTAATCNKRHVTDPNERTMLLEKYKQTQCRYGTACKQMTTGACLYSHDPTKNPVVPMLGSNSVGGVCIPVAGGNSSHSNNSTTTMPQHYQQQQPPPTAFAGSSLRVAVPTGFTKGMSLPSSTISSLPLSFRPMSSNSDHTDSTAVATNSINSNINTMPMMMMMSRRGPPPPPLQSPSPFFQQQQQQQQYRTNNNAPIVHDTDEFPPLQPQSNTIGTATGSSTSNHQDNLQQPPKQFNANARAFVPGSSSSSGW